MKAKDLQKSVCKKKSVKRYSVAKTPFISEKDFRKKDPSEELVKKYTKKKQDLEKKNKFKRELVCKSLL